jgi:type IV pilus assembly protein PilP
MKKIAVALTSLALIACSGDDHEDLRKWMNESSKDIKGKIPPLPEVRPYEPVPYDAGNLIDPFKPAKIESEQKEGGSGGGVRPDLDRPKEPLESYPLETLRYVGVLIKNKAGYAIIQTDASLFQVKIGNYMGQNFGVITKISESEVSLRELVQDAAGDWVERVSTLQLQEKETRK